MDDRLQELRREAAEEILESFDFGHQVVDGQGWEHSTGDDEWVKRLFFADDENPGGDSLKGHLAVRFAPDGDEALDAWAFVDGQPAGNPGVPFRGPTR